MILIKNPVTFAGFFRIIFRNQLKPIHMETKIDFKAITIREKITSRGGGIEIDAHSIIGLKGAKMTAYQNYLGGGMLGRVVGDCNVPNWKNNPKIVAINEQLKEYYFGLTNPEEEFLTQSYEQNQKMPVSAY